MTPPTTDAKRLTSERAALRRRIRRFYEWFNQEEWPKCFAQIDPRLREASKVDPATYAATLAEFRHHYGAIQLRHLEISLHLDARSNKHDARPFAYVYAFWQDRRHEFHLFRERWVKHAGRWYTRVVGLVAHRETGKGQDGPGSAREP